MSNENKIGDSEILSFLAVFAVVVLIADWKVGLTLLIIIGIIAIISNNSSGNDDSF